MIERLLESWLTSISEREFDIPFRWLLEQLGFIPFGRKTTHGPMELGKDVVAQESETGLIHIFQLKAGDATPGDWRDMQTQLLQLVEVDYLHPNYKPGDPYKPLWVVTGEMRETVRTSLALKNADYRRRGLPEVEVWEQNDLIERFKKTLFDVPVTDELFLIDYIRLWSRARDYLTDEIEARSFFRRYLAEITPSNERQQKKLLASYSLIVAQLSHRYLAQQDIYSAIDIVLLGLTVLAEYIVQSSPARAVYSSSLEGLNEFLSRLLQDLIEDCTSDEETITDLFDESSYHLSEIFQLPLRIHSLTSKIALALVLKDMKGGDFTTETRLLHKILNGNPAFAHMVSERQMGTFWITILGVLKSGLGELASALVPESLDWLLSFHAEGEWGLLSPYEPYVDALAHLLDFTRPDDNLGKNRRRHSYLLPVLIKLATILDLRDDISDHWHTISMMSLAEPRPMSQTALFSPISEDEVANLQVILPDQGSWRAIKEQFSERLPPNLTSVIDDHPEFLLYLTLAYPWRTQWREFERYL